MCYCIIRKDYFTFILILIYLRYPTRRGFLPGGNEIYRAGIINIASRYAIACAMQYALAGILRVLDIENRALYAVFFVLK
jgi:hypothetical protein